MLFRRLFLSSKKRILLLVILLAVAGFVGYRRYAKKNGFEKASVGRGEVVEELVLSGEISASQYAELGYETSGRVVYVGVEEGKVVKKGQILGKLDTTVLNATYQSALADLRKYDATVQNIHDQVKDHSSDETYIQKDTRTTAEVNKDKAWEAVIAAERNLKGATLYAPFEGIVTYVANPFPLVTALYNQTQFKVLNPETIFFKVSADQTEVTRMRINQTVVITLDSFPVQEIRGTITRMDYAPDTEEVGVVYGIKVALESINIEYRLGMTGDAKFVMDRAENVLYVPAVFVQSDREGKYLLMNGGDKKVYVEAGIEGEERVEIKGEVNEGDVVYD